MIKWHYLPKIASYKNFNFDNLDKVVGKSRDDPFLSSIIHAFWYWHTYFLQHFIVLYVELDFFLLSMWVPWKKEKLCCVSAIQAWKLGSFWCAPHSFIGILVDMSHEVGGSMYKVDDHVEVVLRRQWLVWAHFVIHTHIIIYIVCVCVCAR